MKILVLTVSDRASRGEYEDLSGPAIEEILKEIIPQSQIQKIIVADEWDEIENALRSAQSMDIILTTGGTGLSPRDITPDVTESWCDRLIPGIAEMLRIESRKQTSSAVLSRGVAGLKGSTVIINFPGSVRGAQFCARLVAPLLSHALDMIAGKGH